MGQRVFFVAGCLHQGEASPLSALCRIADHQTRPAAGGLSWPCRMVCDVADPPAGGAPPAPQPREARTRAATRRAGKALTRGVKIAAAHGPRPRGRGRRPAAWRRDAASGAGPLRRAGLAQAEPHQRGQSRRRASAGRLAGARPDRAGGADGPTAPTEWGPGRAGAPTPRPARGRSKARPRRRRAPEGAWPCFAEGYPRATAGGWQAPQGRRPEPPQAATSRHITPTAAGGRGGRRPSRPGRAGVAARRPLGAGGTRPEGADGSPHQPAGLASPGLAVSSTKPRGRRVGRAGPRPGPRGPPAGPRPDRGRNEAEAGREGRGPPGVRRRAATLRPEGAKRPGHQAGPSAIKSHTGQGS